MSDRDDLATLLARSRRGITAKVNDNDRYQADDAIAAGWRPPRRRVEQPDHGAPPPPRSLPPGFMVGYIAELDDDTEGPQLMYFSGDVVPTEDAARQEHSDAEEWRPGWRIYALTDITERAAE